MNSLTCRVLVSVLLTLATLGGQAANDSMARYQILDTFAVGENVYVRSLLVDAASLWVGSSVGALEIDLLSRTVRNTFTREDGLANEYVFAIGRDGDDFIWFGTNAGGASRYRDGQWQVFFPMHGLADYWVYSFAQQRNGDFWIGTWAGVNRVDLETLEFITYLDELINEWVYGIDVDSQDRVWFGTEGGMSMFDGKVWRQWNHDDGLGAPNINDLPYSTNTGLGTRSRHDLSVQVEGQQSYNPNYIFAVHVTSDDTVWAGTWGGGVSYFKSNQWTNYSTTDGLAGNIVYSIAQAHDGAMWFGTNRGISRLVNGQWQTIGRAEGLPSNHVYAIALTPDGDVWAGVRGAVVRLGVSAPASIKNLDDTK